ncbi:MAG: ATP12 family chaperone protein [Qingshengfaniella sp.]
MNNWAPKRFWTDVTVAEIEGGVQVLLDGRALRTPSKLPLVLPTRALAEAVADEWAAQGEVLDPATMPITRTANSAVETVVPHHAAVAATVAAYGGSDLICYRAEAPADLVRRQAAAWDPLIDWAATELAAPLRVTAGIMHVPQPEASLTRLAGAVRALSPWQLAGFHDLVTLSGSLIIGFATVRGIAPPEDLWRLSRLDEEWQAEQWGADDEASAAAALKAQAFAEAARFYACA